MEPGREKEMQTMKKIQTVAAILAGAVLGLGAAQVYAQVSVPSTNVPVSILDLTTVTSTLNFTVTTTNGVTDADVQLNITHTFDADLEIQLGSPAVPLTMVWQDCGGGLNDLTDTVISDQGAVTNCAAGAPYTGNFQATPGGVANATVMATFNVATEQAGTWTLSIFDDSAADTGTLNAWSITLNGPPPLPVELMNLEVK